MNRVILLLLCSVLLCMAFRAKPRKMASFAAGAENGDGTWFDNLEQRSYVAPWQFVNDVSIHLNKRNRSANFSAMIASSGSNTPGASHSLYPGAHTLLTSYVQFSSEVTLATFARGLDLAYAINRAYSGALFHEIDRTLDRPLMDGLVCTEKHNIRVEVVVCQVSAILFCVVSLRVALCFVFDYKNDIVLWGGYPRGLAVILSIGIVLGLIPLILWMALVHPAFDDLVAVQESAGQNTFEDTDIGYGAIMYMSAYGAFVVLAISAWPLGVRGDREISPSAKFGRKSIYSSIR